jgi:hypothetical protein
VKNNKKGRGIIAMLAKEVCGFFVYIKVNWSQLLNPFALESFALVLYLLWNAQKYYNTHPH